VPTVLRHQTRPSVFIHAATFLALSCTFRQPSHRSLLPRTVKRRCVQQVARLLLNNSARLEHLSQVNLLKIKYRPGKKLEACRCGSLCPVSDSDEPLLAVKGCFVCPLLGSCVFGFQTNFRFHAEGRDWLESKMADQVANGSPSPRHCVPLQYH
jgi:hypothetical protein